MNSGVCDCSRPATRKKKGSYVCDTCLRIEASMYGNKIHANGKPRSFGRPARDPAYLLPRAGELRMKEWREQEAVRLGLSPAAIVSRLESGKYRHLKIRRVNARVVFVSL